MNSRDDRLVYRSAELEIDPLSGCLRRDGQEFYLRPKTLQVLLCLIEHRERLVTKEELIERVWNGIAVTDDVLVQSIVEIRRALGDDSRAPRFIRTFPKTGYHFIGPVEQLRLPGNASAVEIEEVTSVEIEIEESVDDEPLHKSAAPPANSVRRAARLWRAALMLIAAAVMVAAGVGLEHLRRASELTLPQTPGHQAVAVMYFENQSGDRELNWLREGLAEMLITGLSRSRQLTILSRQQLAALMTRTGHSATERLRLEDGLEIARRSGAGKIVLGSFARLGDRVRVDVRLHNGQTGELQAAESLIADRPEQILTQIDLLSLKLATRLGATFADTDKEHRLATLLTNNPDAYRYYSLALEQAQMFQFHEAIALLEKALALDPQFALAHARIGYVYAVRMGEGDKAGPHLERALALADRLSDKDRLFIRAWQAAAAHDPARTIEVYRDLIARYPLETEAYQRLNWAMQAQNRNEEALQVIRQGLLTDPEWRDLYNALGSACMRLGRNEEALAAYQHYIQLAPNDPNAWDSLGSFHQWSGQHEAAEAAYNRALALNPESGVAIIHLGHLRFQQGRYRAACEQYRRFIQIARDDNARARGFSCLAWAYLKQGDLRSAADAIKEEVKYNPASLWNSLALALEQRDQTAVSKLSEEVFATAGYDFYNERGFLRIWEYRRGCVALQQNRAEEALSHFRAALQHRPVEWNIDSFEDCLANACLVLGRTDEAIAEYERILKINPNYPLAHYHLGLAYERRGQPQQARAAYAQFLEHWRDADPDIPELIAAKRRLAALQ
ncbi:MAG TPA: tetratricopeptide repeat protein [Blastocatellia bacterium]|nr:tetratricopeptide repeat protein [Blastocatellia bacterium]